MIKRTSGFSSGDIDGGDGDDIIGGADADGSDRSDGFDGSGGGLGDGQSADDGGGGVDRSYKQHAADRSGSQKILATSKFEVLGRSKRRTHPENFA